MTLFQFQYFPTDIITIITSYLTPYELYEFTHTQQFNQINYNTPYDPIPSTFFNTIFNNKIIPLHLSIKGPIDDIPYRTQYRHITLDTYPHHGITLNKFFIHHTSLISISIINAPNITNIYFISSCQLLKKLTLENCLKLSAISSLSNHPVLTSLIIKDCPIENTYPITACKNLKHIVLSIPSSPPPSPPFNLNFLNDCINLTSLTISCDNLPHNFPNIKCIKLKILNIKTIYPQPQFTKYISNYPNLHTLILFSSLFLWEKYIIPSITPHFNLTSLSINNIHNSSIQSVLTIVPNLISLNLSSNNGIHNPTIISTKLKILNLHACSSLQNITNIFCSNLQTIDISNCHKLTDITSLTNFSTLTHINITNCPQITHILPLQQLPRLRKLNISPHINLIHIINNWKN